jgi:isochorismate hydrolase
MPEREDPMTTDPVRRYNVRKAAPGRCALLAIDLQNYFGEMVRPVLPNVLSLLETCRERKVPILFTQHGHRNPSVDGGMLGEWWGDLIEYGSKNWELLAELNPRKDEPVIEKNRYNAFHGTDLDERLKGLGIEDLIVCGVMTNCCCETTARDAFVRDYRVFFVSDATATANEELHIASLQNLAFGFAHIVQAKQVCRALK